MLTEKALSDFAWCPTLFKDKAGNPKRFKPDRNSTDDTLECIHSALTTGVKNKRVVVSKITGGNKVEGYGPDIWLRVFAGDVQLLVCVAEVTLVKQDGGPWGVFITRNQRRKTPRAEDQLKSEEFLRMILARSFKEYFPRLVVEARTLYEGSTDLWKTQEVSNEQFRQAEEYFKLIEDVYQGDVVRPSNLDRCNVCYFNKECPKAQVAPVENTTLPKLGKTSLNVL